VRRVEFLEKYAGGYQKLRDEGIESLVLESHAHFRQPAVFDDRLQIHTTCHSARGARFRFDTSSRAATRCSPTAGRCTAPSMRIRCGLPGHRSG